MKVLTAAEMRTADRVTAERFGVPTAQLMVQAGEAVARFILREYAGAERIVVVCGMGNNGGDGLVAAAALLRAGRQVHTVLLGHVDDLKGDPKEMLERLGAREQIREVPDADALGEAAELIRGADLLVDAMVGTGFKPPLRGLAAGVCALLAGLTVPVVAVDLPSGWDADLREYRVNGALRADAVVTFTAPKLAHVCGNLTGSAYGPIVVAPIGSPEEAIVSDLRLHWGGTAKLISEKPREADDNKGRHGHVLLFGGSHGKAGAPSMASLAALRAGAGLVTAAVAESILNTVARIAPELMTAPLPEAADGEIDGPKLLPMLKGLVEKKTVIAAGPGLGQGPGAETLVWALVEEAEAGSVLVLDADALNIIAKDMERFARRPAREERRVVLTPHPGEMGRLADLSIPVVQADREGLAQRFAAEYRVTLVLKGWRTLIAHPSGEMAVNTTGNPGMAKGGSGDMLTGIVAALIAQYAKQVEEAVEAAVYLHGLAADFAVRDQDEHTLLVTDVIASLWRAFRFRWRDKAGYVWLEGLPQCRES